MLQRYNPLAEGHVEYAGRTKFGNRRIYTLVEPINSHAVTALEDCKYIQGKYQTAEGTMVRGWAYRPEPSDTEPTPAPEPKQEISDKCERCGATEDLEIFDSDSEVYGVACKCGHMWLVDRIST